jgi:hypothetical protein
MEGRVRAIHTIDEEESGLRALEVPVVRTHVDDSLLMDQHPKYIDPLRWNPMFMKFTEYFADATLARPSSLARGWEMPSLTTAAAGYPTGLRKAGAASPAPTSRRQRAEASEPTPASRRQRARPHKSGPTSAPPREPDPASSALTSWNGMARLGTPCACDRCI